MVVIQGQGTVSCTEIERVCVGLMRTATTTTAAADPRKYCTATF